ncbi:MAG: rhomboid family intramembrane serine protease [Actinobacteria bacterium]|nr:rhomboid family intramembrane serine protease [Actinomycetota bacterium]
MPTTAAGAPIGERPIVSMVLVGICVVVFALEFLIGVDQVTGRFGMYPPDIALNGEIWRLPTSMFLHGNLLHIGFNMLVLWTIGPQVERILGHGRFLVLYLVAGLGGAVASYAFSAPLTLSVGASGAIFGVMGALVVAGRQVGFDVRQVLILIGINVAIGFVGGGIDWRAHLGGLATGAAVAAVMVYAPRASRLLWQTLGVLAILGLLVMITMWRTAELHAMLDAIPGIPA